MDNETDRIIAMAIDEKTLCTNGFTYYSLFKFVDEYCFSEWIQRGHFRNVNDFLEALEFDGLKDAARYDFDAHITLIELIYNFWQLSNKMFKEMKGVLKWCGNYYHLKDVMDDLLDEYNFIAFYNDDDESCIVVENKKEVTAVAEIMPTDKLSYDVIKYNHRSLIGEIELKKSILLSLGSELEPKRKELQNLNKQLSEDIFFMLNNLNLRHNNKSKKDKNYKEYVAKMKKDRLERWYDELYQMMLLAFLLLDNEKRTAKVKELKDKITEAQNGQT